jgi:hypothetical protein
LKKKFIRAANSLIFSLSTISSDFLALPSILPSSIISPARPFASPALSPTLPPSIIFSASSLASSPSIISPALFIAISNDLEFPQIFTNDLQSSPNTIIDFDNEVMVKATGKLLRFKISITIRNRMWQLYISESCILLSERRITGRIRILSRKTKSNTQRTARLWQFCS